MGQRQKGPNYVLQKMTKVPLSIKYQSATFKKWWARNSSLSTHRIAIVDLSL
jgi:hypothetical protein